MTVLRPDLDRMARALQIPVTMPASMVLKSWALRCPDEAYPTVDVEPATDGPVTKDVRRLIGFAAFQNGTVQTIYARTTTVRCEDGSFRVFDVVEPGEIVDVPNVIANVFHLSWCELRDRALGEGKPASCKCKPLDWVNPESIWPVCGKFEARPSEPGACNTCEHLKECHRER